MDTGSLALLAVDAIGHANKTILQGKPGVSGKLGKISSTLLIEENWGIHAFC
jgi:hypothetical protein